MFKISTGLRNHLLATDDLAAALNGKVMRFYDDSGPIPETADAAIGAAQLLCTLTKDDTGVGLSFEALPVDGVLVKSTGETWLGVYIKSGKLAFYRIEASSDNGLASTSAIRAQGSIGLLNADLVIESLTKSLGEEARVDYYAIGMPAQAAS